MTKTKKVPMPGTRERLLETAIDVFGRHGFEAATTRLIAKEANVNISAIPYYFGGKNGLYQAVIRHLMGQIKQEAGVLLDQAAGINFTGDAARDVLKAAIERFINFITDPEKGPRFSRILMREQMFPSPAYDIIFNDFFGPSLNALSNLIMGATGISCRKRAKLRAMTLMGQILIFRIARETVVRGIGLEGYTGEELSEIRGVVVANAMAILDAPDQHTQIKLT